MKKSGSILLNSNLDKVLLVVRKENEYSFPKGHIEEGETILECAIRETIEETGFDIKLLNNEPIGIMKYNHKIEGEILVYMYLFVETGRTHKEIKEMDKEKIEWVSIDNVYDTLSYQNLKDFWKELSPKIKEIINSIK